MELFRLFGSILINNDEADKSLKKTDENAEGVGNTLSKGIGTAAKWGIGLVTAAGAGATALLGIATKASETAATIDDVAQRTNMSATSLQEWKYAAEQSGFSLDTIEGSAKKLTKTMGSYADGNKATIAAFKELGVSATDSTGKLRTTNDVFPEIIASLADMTDITKRDTLSMAIFGKSAMDMGPMLNAGSDGIEAMKIKANELGLVMSDDAISAGADFDDMLGTVKSSLGAIVTKIGMEVLPIAQQILQWISDHMPQIQAIASTAFKAISDAIKFVMDNSNWLIPVLGGLLAAIIALNVINTVTGLMNAWKASTIAQTFAQGGLNAVMAANPIGIVVIAIGLLVAAGVLLYKNWDVVKAKATEVFGAIRNFVNPIIDGIKNGFKGMVNGIISGLNVMIRGLNKLHFTIPDWVPGIGGEGFGFNIPSIPSYAIGTRYLPSDMLIQAHEGEMIVPKSENPYANSGGNVMPTGDFTIKIDKFINNREQDVEALANELAFYMKQKSIAGGIA